LAVADDPLDRSCAYVAAGILFFDDAGRTCSSSLRTTTTGTSPADTWKTGETPAQAAAREVREELDIQAPVGPLLVADWAPHPDEGDKLLLIFDGGTLTAGQLDGIRLQADELASYAFYDPTEAVTVLIPRLSRRVAAAIDAHHAGDTAYL
jgi:8-oxo-dGTP diphosphatase